MSHYLCGVVVPAGTTRDSAADVVEPLMEPFSEQDGDNAAGWWDYWLIGGRWTGVWSKGYDPAQHPLNYEQCFICAGSGRREDTGSQSREDYIIWIGGCNACGGTGHRLKGTLLPFVGDVISVNALLDHPPIRGWGDEPAWTMRLPFRLVLPDGTTPTRERWTIDGVVQPNWAEGTSREYTPLSDEDWNDQARQLLEPYRGQGIVAVDYHS